MFQQKQHDKLKAFKVYRQNTNKTQFKDLVTENNFDDYTIQVQKPKRPAPPAGRNDIN